MVHGVRVITSYLLLCALALGGWSIPPSRWTAIDSSWTLAAGHERRVHLADDSARYSAPAVKPPRLSVRPSTAHASRGLRSDVALPAIIRLNAARDTSFAPPAARDCAPLTLCQTSLPGRAPPTALRS